jgi:membrane-bound lytic murein transglycosylase D
VVQDEILGSAIVWRAEVSEEIDRWITSFQTRESDYFEAYLARMGRYQEMVGREIEARALPTSLRYLPIIESGYSPQAVSRAGAAGLWQFMSGTARFRGLQVTALVDERRDPVLSTGEALDYLIELEERFESWMLVLAAYNGGPGRMDRILARYASDAPRTDSLFWALRGHFPRETQNFIPRFLAAARIAMDPEPYGFGHVEPDATVTFDVVSVPDAASVDVIAQAAEVPQAAIEALNPQLVRGLTPAGVRTALRVPDGRGDLFQRNFAEIPSEERVTFVEHVVVRGETFSHIARMYAVQVGDIQAANPRIEPRRLQIGQRVIVPKAPSARAALRASAGEVGEGGVVVYRVQVGDTLSQIAQRYGVRTTDLARWNGLSLTAIIHPGDEVRIRR